MTIPYAIALERQAADQQANPIGVTASIRWID
jgi:hypothetical protein